MGRPVKKYTTLLIDGNVLMKRSYNGAKHLFYKGEHIGGLYQFYTTLRMLTIQLKINKIVIMWYTTFRLLPRIQSKQTKIF